ncbi:hypothetical protein ERICIV_00500 [Paenibacillus larvae subsp. larvae]|uniref:Uncharacterized protein n=1 Tax=Paenibacillus larvae subsp. larvae TaxID=147375 RepID=A0A2L1U981_9BACL|nr:hypothetical protein [Paenibacillus larvae]AQT85404.1 hypothetical protein B1222_14895 [Paenibacillus larvae subsp. pulvifaciens]AQZ47404.1 hypothetical protein B5S25_13230 [Paenibacillus larvae subsp. pulvifaciens]AVF24733.1 hypothetical protein ERICIII_00500 [Paenibacillus larvae subsp. larvae]AVF29494.1 hypothetical protein ERICIV_00500 [Paenibacillus larvae subsp. larvae]MBH0342428.1 hypothetical protein [Paenibacillus larvae]
MLKEKPGYKTLCMTMAIALIVMLFSPLASSFAAEDRELSPNDPRVQQLAEEMEFVFTQAITQKDKDQQEYELNENKLVNKGFKQEEINGIKQLVAYLNHNQVPNLNHAPEPRSFETCMKDKLMQEFEKLVNIGTLGVLIAEKKWTELAWTLIKKGVKRNPWV